MMRTLILASTALIVAPVAAQDHSGHTMQQEPAAHDRDADQAAMDHAQRQDKQAADMPSDLPPDHRANPLGAIRPVPQRAMPQPQGQAHHSAMDHSATGHGPATAQIPDGPPPARAFDGPAHAAAAFWGEEAMARARAQNRATHGDGKFATLLAERLEARVASGEDAYLWDLSGWYGTGTDRVVFKSEGEGAFGGSVEAAEVQLLWGHAIGPWFDLQTGVRLDVEPDTNAHLALGIAGLAPYNIHLDAAGFLSDDGDVTARIEAEHDMRLTQRLVLQPRVELDLAAQDIPESGVGAGLVKIETGLRLRYEFVPEFAPYVGVEYEAALDQTADYIRAAGDDPDRLVFLIGLRTFF